MSEAVRVIPITKPWMYVREAETAPLAAGVDAGDELDTGGYSLIATANVVRY